jgi:hypothetical protein
MSKDAATEDSLGLLHAKVAKVMTKAIVQIEHAQSLYEDMPDEDKQSQGLVDPPTLSAPLMGVITKFLADNSITCAPAASEEVTGLERALANRAKARTRRQVGNVVHAFGEDDE